MPLPVGRKVCSVEIVQLGIDGLQITGPHVLRGIGPEASDTNVDHSVEEFRLLTTHILGGLLDVTQTGETTVSCLLWVVVVVDFEVSCVARFVSVEIVGTKGDTWELLRGPIVDRAGASMTCFC